MNFIKKDQQVLETYSLLPKIRQIVFDYYLDNASVDYLFVVKKANKIMNIPFYMSPRSFDGYLPVTEENCFQCTQFFCTISRLYVCNDGIDCLTGYKQPIPLFFHLKDVKKTINIDIFTSFNFFETVYGAEVLNPLMGFSRSEYDYFHSDIYYDYFNSSNESIKNYAYRSISKYCLLYFMIHYLISKLGNRTKNYLLYFKIYFIVIKIINGKIKNPKIKEIYDGAKKYFDSETDVIKMTIYKYGPLKTNFDHFNAVFSSISYSEIESKIKILHNKNYKN